MKDFGIDGQGETEYANTKCWIVTIATAVLSLSAWGVSGSLSALDGGYLSGIHRYLHCWHSWADIQHGESGRIIRITRHLWYRHRHNHRVSVHIHCRGKNSPRFLIYEFRL